MKSIYKYELLMLYLTLNNLSCNKPPCECNFSPTHSTEIKFSNQQGQNLVFGQTAVFQIDSIYVLKEKNNLDINNASVRKGLIDSNTVRFDFYIPAEKSFIYYNYTTSQDSLEIKWLIKTGKCCGNLQEYNDIDSVKFNSILIKPINGVYNFIK